MIPAAFDYVRARSVEEAIHFLHRDQEGTKLLAGGHSLIPILKLRLASPSLLVDIRSLSELKGIEISDQIRIGALTTHAQLLTSEVLQRMIPLFHLAAQVIADPQVRNRGTIGGSLANADPAADWPAVVIALGAEVEIAGPKGRRRIPAAEFFVDILTTALASDEIVIAVHMPRPEAQVQFSYRKIRHPASGYAVVGVAAAVLRQKDGRLARARFGVTGASGHPFCPEAASAFLAGKMQTAEVVEHAAEVACQSVEFLADHYAPAEYRRHLLKTEFKRALQSIRIPT